jgi:hypothetical protein
MQLVVFSILALILTASRVARGAAFLPALESSLLFVVVGLAGVSFALGHLARGPWVAERIGWPAHNPFQQEVAAANLALGALGLASPFFGPDFALAAAIGYAIFYWGCAITHLRDERRRGNHAPFNRGALVHLSFILPAVLLGLLIARRAGVAG